MSAEMSPTDCLNAYLNSQPVVPSTSQYEGGPIVDNNNGGREVGLPTTDFSSQARVRHERVLTADEQMGLQQVRQDVDRCYM